MRRWIFNILAAISLVLCLATAGLWIHSYWRRDGLLHLSAPTAQRQRTDQRFWSISGILIYAHSMTRYSNSTGPPMVGWFPASLPSPTATGILIQGASRNGVSIAHFGFGHRHFMASGPPAGTRDDWDVFLPHWFLCFLLAIAPARWLFLKRREIRNRPRHLCKNCGYDLRATPDADGPLLERCLEYGTEVEAKQASAL